MIVVAGLLRLLYCTVYGCLFDTVLAVRRENLVFMRRVEHVGEQVRVEEVLVAGGLCLRFEYGPGGVAAEGCERSRAEEAAANVLHGRLGGMEGGAAWFRVEGDRVTASREAGGCSGVQVALPLDPGILTHTASTGYTPVYTLLARYTRIEIQYGRITIKSRDTDTAVEIDAREGTVTVTESDGYKKLIRVGCIHTGA